MASKLNVDQRDMKNAAAVLARIMGVDDPSHIREDWRLEQGPGVPTIATVTISKALSRDEVDELLDALRG